MPRRLVIPFFIPHQGCPHQCRFCNQIAIAGPPIRAAELDRTVREYLSPDAGIRYDHIEIAFYGGTFLGLPRDLMMRLLVAAQAFIDRKEVQGIRFSTRPDPEQVEATLPFLSSYDISTIEFGVQSLSDAVLSANNRGHRARDVLKAVAAVRRPGLRLGLQLMVGLLGDSAREWKRTVDQTVGLSPDFVRIYPTLVMAGSQLAEDFKKGRYTPMSVSAAVEATLPAYVNFRQKGIRVARMGLQATRDLDAGSDILGGPYHPAFGQLVQSRLYLSLARKAVYETGWSEGELILQVADRSRSVMIGQKRANLDCLKSDFKATGVRVVSDERLGPEAVRVGTAISMLKDLSPWREPACGILTSDQ